MSTGPDPSASTDDQLWDAWLDTEEKEAAAFAVIERLWKRKGSEDRRLLEGIVFMHVYAPLHSDGPIRPEPDDPRP